MQAWLSLMGLYRWDKRIFDHFSLPSQVNKETLTTMMLAEFAELEILYPDPETFDTILQVWSAARLPSWQKLADALDEKYDPLWNKDGTITETTTGSGTTNQKLQVSAFNSDELHDSQASTGNSSGSSSTTRRETGNIGVTTSQAMLTEEVELRSRYDIYHLIMAEFKRRFCIMVY